MKGECEIPCGPPAPQHLSLQDNSINSVHGKVRGHCITWKVATLVKKNVPMAPTGTVLFATVGRLFFGFDVYSVEIPPSFGQYASAGLVERRITDGTSVNFNGSFVDEEGTVVFISERTGSPIVYAIRPGTSVPEPLPSIEESLFHDRPVVKNGRLYLVSNHERPEEIPNCWTPVYSTGLNDGKTKFRRLTPFGAADFSPAVSKSGEFVAVASYGQRQWDSSDYTDLKTDIVVFKDSEPARRTVVCRKGGWPTWFGDSTVFFHRQCDDGWWSIFRADLPENFIDLDDVSLEARRVTPSGVHAFTPSVSHDGKRIAVATRRPGTKFRHVEIFDVETETFHPVTESINPGENHYNPFFSPASGFLGYHRYRGDRDAIIPHLEQVRRNEEMERSEGPVDVLDGVEPDRERRHLLVRGNDLRLRQILGSGRPSRVRRRRFDGNRNEVPVRVKVLTRVETGNNAFPSVSPDGKRVVFRLGRSGHKNLYVMDAIEGEFHGDGVKRLTKGPWTDTMPSWSPDGEIIAFSSNRHNTADPESFALYLVRPDGSELRRIHVEGPPGSADSDKVKMNHVVFSADSKWLIFCANLAGVSAESVSMPHMFQPFGDIFACRIDGSHLTRLTWTAFENGTPAFHAIGEKEVGPLALTDADFDKLEGQFDELKWLQHV
ncbi:hypothetical protein H6P81_004416 [Aristolochia fimbriata]|uniref:Uncharacterized protein n=1 Tax=Aristolochia fimbriata TaxID=158543 RepID=A0AAV7FFH8_ARIFI|nr:hypothetical protein H6P81_004416 [Aristolochia fimbriata]